MKMKELSFFLLLKNSLGAKMKRGGGGFCNGDASTSTLDQRSSPTRLEEVMIMKLGMEEEEDANNKDGRRRSSCAMNTSTACSDNILLMSARDALNQYPRFSLDGKDAMYRSSFRNTATNVEGRRSVCCDQGTLQTRRNREKERESRTDRIRDSVVWCKPGVVAKLMGLEAMPSRRRRRTTTTTMTTSTITNKPPR